MIRHEVEGVPEKDTVFSIFQLLSKNKLINKGYDHTLLYQIGVIPPCLDSLNSEILD